MGKGILAYKPRERAIICKIGEQRMREPVLVLNANFEPLNVCTTRRAITLILAGKASLVLNGRGVIHTVNFAYPRPSVIRLERMVKRPRLRVRLTNREILRRGNYT